MLLSALEWHLLASSLSRLRLSAWLGVLPMSRVPVDYHPGRFLNSARSLPGAIQIAACPLLPSASLVFTGHLLCGWDTVWGQG